MAPVVQCEICFRSGSSKLPFLCATDARNALYEPRMANARTLLENAKLDKQISALISVDAKAKSRSADVSENGRWRVNTNNGESDSVVDWTEQIMAQADRLRANIAKARAEIAAKKTDIARRKSEMASAVNGLEQRRNRQIEDVEKSIKIGRYRLYQIQPTTENSRAFLSGEAAKLFNLRRIVNGDPGKEEYTIGGVPIVDLRLMNTSSPAHITTSLSHIAQLLVLASRYLSIRLPAEISLPHRDYPLPTILPISVSHIHTNLPFPRTPFNSSSNSPSTSRHIEQNNLPHPRPLFIHKPLPQLSKEDPGAHAHFLEGVTLLAYNIAWVCKSQGVHIETAGPATFEDICAIGRNFFNLLLGNTPRQNPRTPSISSTALSTPTDTPKKSARVRSDSAEPSEHGKRTYEDFGAIVGRYSHGTSQFFLGSTEGNEFVKSFKLPSLVKLTDKLKSYLSNETTGTGWEFVDEDAWADPKDLEDDGVVVGARRLSSGAAGKLGRGFGAMQSFMSMRTVMDAVEIVDGADEEDGRKPGTSGWTKLKPR